MFEGEWIFDYFSNFHVFERIIQFPFCSCNPHFTIKLIIGSIWRQFLFSRKPSSPDSIWTLILFYYRIWNGKSRKKKKKFKVLIYIQKNHGERCDFPVCQYQCWWWSAYKIKFFLNEKKWNIKWTLQIDMLLANKKKQNAFTFFALNFTDSKANWCWIFN